MLNDVDLNKNPDEDDYEMKHRATFCGTAEYVSPEMLYGDEVGFEADYWALGCIIYKLITGISPFKEKSQFLVFQNIKNLTIKWPDSIPPSAKDLIKRLLVHKPFERIGSKNIKEIIDHEFFINNDGENIIVNMKSNNIPYKNSIKTKKAQEEQKLGFSSQKKTDKKEIKILREQVVEKKSPYFHYNTRLLKLDNTPKLEYSDPDSKKVKGIIYLFTDCEAKIISSSKFELITPKRSFLFKVDNDEAGVWCKCINDEIMKMLENPRIKEQNEIYITEEKEIITKSNDDRKVY